MTTTYTLNHVSFQTIEKTLYKVWSGKRPYMSYINILGCEVYVKRQISTKILLLGGQMSDTMSGQRVQRDVSVWQQCIISWLIQDDEAKKE